MDKMLKLSPLLLLMACACPPPPEPASPPQARGPRLISRDKELLVIDLPSACIRGKFLYAQSADPIPHTKVHPVVGVLQCVDANTYTAAWICKPMKAAEEFPAEPGLPVAELRQDTLARSGKCLTRFQGQDASFSEWNEEQKYADITLDVGSGEDVKDGDQFSLLGPPIADAVNRTVTDFVEVARCAVQPFKVQTAHAACRVDLQVWGFTKAAWIKGGPAVWMPVQPLKY